jgi:single-stranded-DNA-specific exonuclease
VQSRWILAPREELNGSAIPWREICGCDCIARLLMRKRLGSAEEVQNFLQPRLKSLSDPFLLPNMEAAVARLLAAVDDRERIVLFGDYDVDGVTSLALLAEALRAYGAAPELFLPLRMEEGYGLSRESVERCLQQHRPQVLLALDCGTSSVEEIADLSRRGVDVIVLDHHEPPLRSYGFTGEPKSALPKCATVVNPKADPESPFHYLCSVGIVFKLCHALLKRRPLDFDLKSKLDLVALGTVADIVPLRGENRTLVQRGAVELAKSRRPGLRKLIELSGVKPPILPDHVGFRLGPRLNAAGRLSTAEKALRLLLTTNEPEANELADFLDAQNRERQEVEKTIFAAAEAKIAAEFDPSRDAAIIVSAPDWHPGVLGIVASRISRKYHRPTIVLSFDAEGTGKGSGRSIEGLNLVEALSRCAGNIGKYGGHQMAAGLTIQQKDADVFAAAFQAAARELLSDDALQPLFFAREVEPARAPLVVGEKHLALRLRQRNYHHRAVYFDGAAEPLPQPPWDLAFSIRAGEYEGEERLEMQIHAVRESAPID